MLIDNILVRLCWGKRSWQGYEQRYFYQKRREILIKKTTLMGRILIKLCGLKEVFGEMYSAAIALLLHKTKSQWCLRGLTDHFTINFFILSVIFQKCFCWNPKAILLFILFFTFHLAPISGLGFQTWIWLFTLRGMRYHTPILVRL